ncbi:MAG: hypothetical protein CMI21_04230 [Opitutae bacterium]|nr:hypothetical protein [Opitutae bacterium]
MKNLVYPFLALLGASPSTSAKVEVHEISKNNVELLPGGKEADGIIGDFVLRNNLIECVIGGSADNRKANMGAFWKTLPTPVKNSFRLRPNLAKKLFYCAM